MEDAFYASWMRLKKLKKPKNKNSRALKPGGVAEYIAACPKESRAKLKDIRSAIREVVCDAVETVSYFDMPGYSYDGYVYNGMFAWFSFKKPFVRLHVRPQALIKYKKGLEGFTTTRAIISFPVDKPIPKALVKKLVRASLKDMIDAS
ncbi:MAG: iron chaperone [Bacteriovoracia bacterium]